MIFDNALFHMRQMDFVPITAFPELCTAEVGGCLGDLLCCAVLMPDIGARALLLPLQSGLTHVPRRLAPPPFPCTAGGAGVAWGAGDSPHRRQEG